MKFPLGGLLPFEREKSFKLANMIPIMGVYVQEKPDGRKYYYFRGGGGMDVYLAPVDEPGKASIENVVRSLKYMDSRVREFEEEKEKLLSLLPPAMAESYRKQRVVTTKDVQSNLTRTR